MEICVLMCLNKSQSENRKHSLFKETPIIALCMQFFIHAFEKQRFNNVKRKPVVYPIDL